MRFVFPAKLRIVNKSRYPDAEVRRLVRFATRAFDMTGVYIVVKNSRRYYSGHAQSWWYADDPPPEGTRYIVTLRVGPEEMFPAKPHVSEHAAGSRVAWLREDLKDGDWFGQWPVVSMADWREALVHIAAHEAHHTEQFRLPKKRKRGKKMSEVDCECFAARMLREYRAELRKNGDGPA